MTAVLGPIPCLTCKRPVVWDRIGGSWRLVERRGNTYQRHDCPGRVDERFVRPDPKLCGAWMPSAKEHCARRPGHIGPDHRTAYAMECQRIAHRTGRVDNFGGQVG